MLAGVAGGSGLVWSAPPAWAAGSLIVDPGRLISLLDQWSPITISGEGVAQVYSGAGLTVRIEGPAALGQIGDDEVRLPVAASWRMTASTVGPPSGGAPTGRFTFVVPPSARTLSVPGAYRVTVSVGGGEVASSGVAWMGKVAPSETPLDLAFVWPAALGIHRDPAGVFIDRVLETVSEPLPAEVVPAGPDPGAPPAAAGRAALTSLLGLSERFPGWRLTFAVEPVLLAQLRDMADGYRRAGDAGGIEDVGADEAPALNAAAALAGFAALGSGDAVEAAVMPYATPDLAVLAREGWRDGFEQLQLGKQEVGPALGLELPPVGAYSPGLGLTAGSLGEYGRASIDYVVVDGGLAAALEEPPAAGAVAVRARNFQADRVTLVFADGRLRDIMGPPWDAGVFFAGLAAVIAAGSPPALVVTPGAEYVIPPQAYLDTIGRELAAAPWISTTTLAGLLAAHPPEARPVVFAGDDVDSLGYIGDTLLAEIQASHALVGDLGAIADPARVPLETSRRLLYTAQSRWWYRIGATPREASTGLAYAIQAGAIARGELDKIAITQVGPPVVWGGRGTLRIDVENGTGYPVEVAMELSGGGAGPGADRDPAVTLQPGANVLTVEMEEATSPKSLTVRVLAGSSVLDEWTADIRFVTWRGIVPWVVLGLALIAAVVGGLSVTRRRRRRARA